MMRPPRPRSALAPLALILLAVACAFSATRASATFPVGGVVTLSSDHFMVHYSRNDQDSTCQSFITQEHAGEVLGMFERAYALYGTWGYPAPVADADAHVDLAVDDFVNACIVYGSIPPTTPVPWGRWDAIIAPIAPPGANDIHLDSKKALTYHIIAHELFMLVEDAIAPGADPWLREGTAEWAAVRANLAIGGSEKNTDRTIDCVGAECGDTEFDKNGYGGWLLFEYLAERYGDSAVRAVWDQAALNPGAPGTTDLAAVLPSGTTLATFFNDYTTARLTGNFTLPLLAGTLPASYGTTVVSDSSGALPTSNVAVNHLAVRYLAFQHGTDPAAACFAATLTLNVQIPAGVASTPYYYAHTKGSAAQALTVTGSTGSLTVPWNTCAGSPDAYLSLPNGTLGMDGREFVVTGTVSVDKSTPANATDPPAPVKVIGPIISAPTTDPAPTMKVYAPEVIHVSAKTRLLRFAVFSSGEGKLQATLGSTSLGSAALRGGNNDIRFVLPQQMLKSLRVKSPSSLLQLTSVSPSGSKGMTVTRRIAILAAKKPTRRR
jgi:hypothetical protein